MKPWTRLGCLLVIISLSLTAQSSLDRKQKCLLILESRIDSLSIIREQGIQSNKLLAGQIHQNNTDLSYSEHRKLEKQFRQAQILDQQIKAAEHELNRLYKIHQDTLQSLIIAYQNLLDHHLSLAEKAKNETDRNMHLEQAQRILYEKEAWTARFKKTPDQDKSQMAILRTPWDDGESLSMKRDALLDQEESLRREIRSLDRKMDHIQKENRLRQKMAEMTGELNLFSENEETMDRVVMRGHTSNETQIFNDPGWGIGNVDEKNTFDTRGETVSPTLYPYTGQAWETVSKNNKNSLSMDTQITIMQDYKKALTARADSLAKRANWFDGQARSLKKAQEQSQ